MNLRSKVAKRVADAQSRNESLIRTAVGVAIDLAFLVFAIYQLLAEQGAVATVLFSLMIVFVGQRIVSDVLGRPDSAEVERHLPVGAGSKAAAEK